MAREPAFLLVFALPALMFSVLAGSEILGRAMIAVDGRITDATITCEWPNNNWCVSYYVIQQGSGSTIRYDAASNDQSLARKLPVGTVLEKEKWSLVYKIDGKVVDDFPRYFYFGVLAICGTTAVIFITLFAIAIVSRRSEIDSRDAT